MTKAEVAKELRKKLTQAIRRLPDDVEYQCTGIFLDTTTQMERDHDGMHHFGDNCDGTIHVIELTAEEKRQ